MVSKRKTRRSAAHQQQQQQQEQYDQSINDEQSNAIPNVQEKKSPVSSPLFEHPIETFSSAITKAISGGVSLLHTCSTEVKTLLRTDLLRLPDVQHLILEHIGSLDSLQEHVVAHASASMHSVQQGFRNQFAKMPDIHQLVTSNLENLPAWRKYIASKLPNVNFSHLSPGEVSEVVTEAIHSEERSLRDELVLQLNSLPSIRQAFARSVLSVEGTMEHIQTVVANNSNILSDVHDLILSNVHKLPNLEKMVHDHYLSFKPSLKSFRFVPEYMQDNCHVLTGYRPELVSFRRCFNSLFYLHNESVNIYSHLLGAVMFLIMAIVTSYYFIQDHTFADRFSIYLFFTGAIVCLGCSAVFHTCFAHSHKMNNFFTKLDYSGITALIYASVVSFIYFLLYCHPYQQMYIGVTTFFGLLCAIASFSDRYREPHQKWVRVVLFTSFASTGVLPFFQHAYTYGFPTSFLVSDLFWVLGVSAPLYLVGAYVYVTKFPECFFPGQFDIWFSSHQLWHFFVVAAALAHFNGVYNMFYFRQEHKCGFESAALDALSII